MKKRAVVLALVATMAALRAGLGCEDEPKPCYPGELLGCFCDGDRWGYAECLNFEVYGPCACVDPPGVDAGRGDGGGGLQRDAAEDADARAADAASTDASDADAEAGT